MPMGSLQDVMVDLLRDLYHAEKQLVAALPKMQKAAASTELREAMGAHLEETKEHVRRLEQVFEALEMKPSTKMCHGMKGLVEEGKEVIAERGEGNPAAVDAALIAAAQKVEHYEITAYGTLSTFARTLGRDDIASIFKLTLDEEETADKLLSSIAQGSINAQAAEPGGDDGDEASSAPSRSAGRAGASKARRSAPARKKAASSGGRAGSRRARR